MLRYNSIIISADFETTKYQENKNAQVYSWAFCFNKKYQQRQGRHRFLIPKKLIAQLKDVACEIKKELIYFYGIKLKDFVTLITSVTENCFLLFQNGAKFDLHFFIKGLQKQNFIRVMDYYNPAIFDQYKNKDYDLYMTFYLENLTKRGKLEYFLDNQHLNYETLAKELKKLSYKEYYALEVNHHYFYIKICVGKRRKQKIYVLILDPYKQFVSPLAIKAKEVNLTKEVIDYNRLISYQNIKEFQEDEVEVSYLLKDVEILYRHTIYMYNILKFENVQLTAASIAYKQIILSFINQELQYLIDKKFISQRQLKKVKGKRNSYSYKIINKNLKEKLKPSLGKSKYLTKKKFTHYIFSEVLAEKSLSIKDNIILNQKYYRGGICHVNEAYRGKIVPAFGYDINSSYPNVMNSGELCPIGKPLNIKPNLFDSNYYCFIHITALKNIEFPNDLPFLRSTEFDPQTKIFKVKDKLKVFHSKRTYINKIKINDHFYITTTEFIWLTKLLGVNNEKTFERYFSFSIDYVFKSTYFRYYFQAFVLKWYKIKQNDPNKRTIAKIILNSGYGKFAQKQLHIQAFYEGDKKLDIDVYNCIKNHYLPLGIAIPAQARINLCKAVHKHYKSFIYGDTDSAYFIKKIPSIPLSDKLGDWKLEGVFTHFLARRGKQYVGVNFKQKVAKMTISGVHLDQEFRYHNIDKKLDKEKRTFIYFINYMGFENFLKGYKFHNQLNAFRFDGGVNLINIEKELSPTWSNSLKFNLNQTKIIQEHYYKEIKAARYLDELFNLPLSQSNYSKIKLDLNYLDNLCFEKQLKQKKL